jgi:hypothetical protein
VIHEASLVGRASQSGSSTSLECGGGDISSSIPAGNISSDKDCISHSDDSRQSLLHYTDGSRSNHGVSTGTTPISSLSSARVGNNPVSNSDRNTHRYGNYSPRSHTHTDASTHVLHTPKQQSQQHIQTCTNSLLAAIDAIDGFRTHVILALDSCTGVRAERAVRTSVNAVMLTRLWNDALQWVYREIEMKKDEELAKGVCVCARERVCSVCVCVCVCVWG